jgi:predicted CoA-binding protein
MQQGSESEKAVSYCRENGIQVVQRECILMFAESAGFPHNLHRGIWGLLGKLPR